MAKRKRLERARTARRALERRCDKLLEMKRKLACLEVGGSSERPICVASASVIEPQAEAVSCLVCGGSVRSIDHAAREQAGVLLRIVTLACRDCGSRDERYFRVISNLQ